MTDNAARDVIAEYRAAYEAAHGRACPAIRLHGSGRYRIDGYAQSYRLSQLAEMAKTLRKGFDDPVDELSRLNRSDDDDKRA